MSDLLAIGEAVDNVKDSFDLWYAFIIGLPGLIAAVGVIYGQRKAKARWTRQEQHATDTLDEVRNDHTENLRDEISRGFREIRGDIKHLSEETKADIRGLRDDLSVERKERIEGDRREAE